MDEKNIETNSKFKDFIKNKKNVLILIIAFLVLSSLFSALVPDETAINDLKSQLETQASQIKSLEEQITLLQNNNETLKSEKQQLENEKK